MVYKLIHCVLTGTLLGPEQVLTYSVPTVFRITNFHPK